MATYHLYGKKTSHNPLPSPPADPPKPHLPHWKIQSKATPHQFYWVHLDLEHPNGWVCTCPNYRRFEHRSQYTCKHVRLAKDRLAEQMLRRHAIESFGRNNRAWTGGPDMRDALEVGA